MTEADFDRVVRFYDLETEGLNEDIPFYIEYAKKGGAALELACGTGRVLIPMAEAGITVVGLDISGEMLKVAEVKIKALDGEVKRRIELVQGDMRHFDLGRRFPLIFIAFRSFQNLLTKEDQGLCLECVREHLEPRGRLIIDLFAPRYDLLAQRKVSLYLKGFYDREWVIFVTRRAEVKYDLVKQTLKEDRFYEWTDQEGQFHRLIWSYRISYLFRYEAELLLKNHGFELEDLFGGFDKSPYDHSSGEQIFVAKRR